MNNSQLPNEYFLRIFAPPEENINTLISPERQDQDLSRSVGDACDLLLQKEHDELLPRMHSHAQPCPLEFYHPEGAVFKKMQKSSIS